MKYQAVSLEFVDIVRMGSMRDERGRMENGGKGTRAYLRGLLHPYFLFLLRTPREGALGT